MSNDCTNAVLFALSEEGFLGGPRCNARAITSALLRTMVDLIWSGQPLAGRRSTSSGNGANAMHTISGQGQASPRSRSEMVVINE